MLNFRVREITSTDDLTDSIGKPDTQLILQHPYSTFYQAQSETTLSKQSALRLVNSARRTQKLQSIALSAMQKPALLLRGSGNTVNLPCDDKGVILYGYHYHYLYLYCWGSQDSTAHILKRGRTPSTATVGGYQHGGQDRGHPSEVRLSSVLKAPDRNQPLQSLQPLPKFEFGQYYYTKRCSDKAILPLPNRKLIASKKSLAEMVCCGFVTKLLAVEGIIPVLVSPNHLDRQRTIRAPFGPLLDSSNQPYEAGTCFKASHLYGIFRMKKAVDHHDRGY